MADAHIQSAASLQFDTVETTEPGGLSCAFCKVPIGQTYFEINRKVACPNCQAQVARLIATRGGPVSFVKALVFGVGAGAAGAIVWYAVREVTKLEIGLIAIVVGMMVGRAVRQGSGNRGGLAYQILAVLLTYLAIVSANAPLVWSAFRTGISTSVARQYATTANEAAPDPNSAPVQARVSEIVDHLPMVAWASIAFFVLESPFLGGVSNVIGWLIIFFGLMQAWRLTRATPLQLSGPFSLAERGAA